MDIILLEGECSKSLFSSVRPWDPGMMVEDEQAKPDSQKANHHPISSSGVWQRPLFSMESGHEPCYTLSPNTILHLGAISSLAQEMEGLRYWELVLPV